MNVKSVLFGERAAGVYRKSEIYDPKLGTSPEASGKIVPQVGSLVIDDTVGLHNQIYVVTAVNQLTYESTLIPATFVVDAEAQVDRVLSYGNDIFMLYFSSVVKTVSGSNINLTRLIVDNKLSLFGKHAATYQLIRIDDDGNEQIISRKYSVGNANELVPEGTSIPMLDTGVEGVRKCDGCYTDVTLDEGEEVRCDVYTAGGILISQIRLIAKKAHLLNETIDTSNPIIGMEIKGTQQTAEGDLYLFQGQNVRENAIYVDLKYKDGSSQIVAIDNRRGFCYGLETVTSGIVGSEFEITVKYYLSDSDATGEIIQDGGDVVSDNRTRFITKTAKIKIISGAKDLISKISPIPKWNVATGKWELDFLRYRDSRLQSPYAAEHSSDPEFVTIRDFDGGKFLEEQTVTVTHREIINNLGSVEEKTQAFIIELRDKTDPDTGNNFWLIKDTVDAPVSYGDYTNGHLRPRIVYRAGSGYFIPDTVFAENTTQSAVEVFLENFYTNANPPKRSDESIAPTPTHFRVKMADANGTPLTRTAIPVENFADNLNIITAGNQENFLIGKTVVVEFLREIDSATCEYLYGVPVDVI